jgi:hypothetical protein
MGLYRALNTDLYVIDRALEFFNSKFALSSPHATLGCGIQLITRHLPAPCPASNNQMSKLIETCAVSAW